MGHESRVYFESKIKASVKFIKSKLEKRSNFYVNLNWKLEGIQFEVKPKLVWPEQKLAKFKAF